MGLKAKAPFRAVLQTQARTGHAILNSALYTQWWDLHLECGHMVERALRFPPQEAGKKSRRGYAALHRPRAQSEALPAPKRVRCKHCAHQESRS